MNEADANWWNFAIDEATRKEHAFFTGNAAINPNVETNPNKPPRHTINYNNYVGLDQLLACQRPGTSIPDERIFLVTHQLFELIFKQMIFDFTVIGKTFHSLLQIEDEEKFLATCHHDEEFWLPATTAAHRIRYSAAVVLPSVIGYLKQDDKANGQNGFDKGETFHAREFYRFRDVLIPASGFQSVAYRLVQIGFGKANLLDIRLYPGETYCHHYGHPLERTVRVTDEIILGPANTVLSEPAENEPIWFVHHVDRLVHEAIARFHTQGNIEVEPVSLLTEHDFDLAVEQLKRNFEETRNKAEEKQQLSPKAVQLDSEAVTLFQEDLRKAILKENARRKNFAKARLGAKFLWSETEHNYLTEVVKSLMDADDCFHGNQGKSFLKTHLQVAANRTGGADEYAKKIGKEKQASGTGGGGPMYLGFMLKEMVPFFPALVACRNLE